MQASLSHTAVRPGARGGKARPYARLEHRLPAMVREELRMEASSLARAALTALSISHSHALNLTRRTPSRNAPKARCHKRQKARSKAQASAYAHTLQHSATTCVPVSAACPHRTHNSMRERLSERTGR